MVDRDAFDRYLALSEELGDVEPEPTVSFDDPRVVSVVQTCFGCPDAYEGRLRDDRLFYFRYRHGHVSLSVGADLDQPDARVGQFLGEDLQGVFDSREQRDEVFTWLLDEVERTT